MGKIGIKKPRPMTAQEKRWTHRIQLPKNPYKKYQNMNLLPGNVTLGTGRGTTNIYASVNQCKFINHKQIEAAKLDTEKLKDLRACHFKLGNW